MSTYCKYKEFPRAASFACGFADNNLERIVWGAENILEEVEDIRYFLNKDQQTRDIDWHIDVHIFLNELREKLRFVENELEAFCMDFRREEYGNDPEQF